MVGDEARRQVRLASGLAGGLGGTQQEMCGALSGGVLVIGALYGRECANDDDPLAYRLSACYRESFRAELGDTQCARLRETVVHGTGGLGSCAVLVERAAGILLRVLRDCGEE